MFRTPLYEMHTAMGAKMGNFAGFEMPLWYPQKIISEHLHTRRSASLFDISHMGQITISGGDAGSVLEKMIPSDLVSLGEGRMRYCCFTNEAGGILDDLMVSKFKGTYYLVVNAARKVHDVAHLHKHFRPEQIQIHTDRALIALQGPKAVQALSRLFPTVKDQKFLSIAEYEIKGISLFISRSGYSGEDGFEISIPTKATEEFVKNLLELKEVKFAGLGARDSLRMEAGLRLYGQDMTEQTTPVEAGIGWTVSHSRRRGGERAGGFHGEAVIFGQLEHGVNHYFTGIKLETKVPARTGVTIATLDGTEVGKVTSGGFAPTVDAPIAMGYVQRETMQSEAAVNLIVRGKPQLARLTNLPFVEHRYAG